MSADAAAGQHRTGSTGRAGSGPVAEAEGVGPVTADGPETLLVQLCADLRLMWQQAGGPSLRRLAEQVRLGKSQVGAILNGQVRTLPDWTVIRALVECFGRYAHDHGRTGQLSLRTGVDEYWRPRYTLLEYAFSQPRQRRAPAAAHRPQRRPCPASCPPRPGTSPAGPPRWHS